MHPTLLQIAQEGTEIFQWDTIGPFLAAVGVGLLILERVWKMVEKYIPRPNGSAARAEEDRARAEAEQTRVLSELCARVQQLIDWHKPGTAPPADVDMREMARQVGDLHEWHSQRDDDGVFVWWIRRSFYKALEQNTQALEKLASLVAEFTREQHENNAKLDALQAKIDQAPTQARD